MYTFLCRWKNPSWICMVALMFGCRVKQRRIVLLLQLVKVSRTLRSEFQEKVNGLPLQNMQAMSVILLAVSFCSMWFCCTGTCLRDFTTWMCLWCEWFKSEKKHHTYFSVPCGIWRSLFLWKPSCMGCACMEWQFIMRLQWRWKSNKQTGCKFL